MRNALYMRNIVHVFLSCFNFQTHRDISLPYTETNATLKQVRCQSLFCENFTPSSRKSGLRIPGHYQDLVLAPKQTGIITHRGKRTRRNRSIRAEPKEQEINFLSQAITQPCGSSPNPSITAFRNTRKFSKV